MTEEHGLPIARACQAARLSRAAYYKPGTDWVARDAEVIAALQAIVVEERTLPHSLCYRAVAALAFRPSLRSPSGEPLLHLLRGIGSKLRKQDRKPGQGFIFRNHVMFTSDRRDQAVPRIAELKRNAPCNAAENTFRAIRRRRSFVEAKRLPTKSHCGLGSDQLYQRVILYPVRLAVTPPIIHCLHGVPIDADDVGVRGLQRSIS